MNRYQILTAIAVIQIILYFIFLLLIIFLALRLLTQPKRQTTYIDTSDTPVSVTSCPNHEDSREIRLKAFLETRASRMAKNTTYFVQTADKYGLDWTLIPSISGIESNFGKSMPENSNNPFGIGGRGPARFSSIPEAIEYEGKLLSKYKLAANKTIGSIYCPKEECNDDWAEIVTDFSNQILYQNTE